MSQKIQPGGTNLKNPGGGVVFPKKKRPPRGELKEIRNYASRSTKWGGDSYPSGNSKQPMYGIPKSSAARFTYCGSEKRNTCVLHAMDMGARIIREARLGEECEGQEVLYGVGGEDGWWRIDLGCGPMSRTITYLSRVRRSSMDTVRHSVTTIFTRC